MGSERLQQFTHGVLVTTQCIVCLLIKPFNANKQDADTTKLTSPCLICSCVAFLDHSWHETRHVEINGVVLLKEIICPP